MSPEPKANQKGKQMTLAEYMKIKEQVAKSKLKLHFPWIIKVCFAIPAAYCLFLIIYFLVQLRFLSEH